jgi:hypothetical protein
MLIPNSKSVREVAMILKVSERRVLELIRTTELTATNTSRGSKQPRWRILDEDLAAFGRKDRQQTKKVPNYV